ncbi:hypothetical protein HID58_006952, partial [Brassica napus]
ILSPSLDETYILNMAKAAIILFDLKTGRCSSTIQVRLLRFLESMNLRWGSELMGVDMFLLDSQSTMMPATVNVNRLAIHMPNLKVGSLYSLAGFDVTRCNQNYRLSDSSMMVRFSDSTCFDEITEPAIPIFPVHELLGLANTNTQLPDIIGEITAAKSTVTDPPHDKNHLMATIKMDNDVSVTMSMFDSQPVKLHNQLESMGGDPRVLVATSLNPKIVGGHLFLNATSGTRIYFDKETIAGETSTGCIADLNEFVNSASSQEIDFICTEKVTGIKLDKGWCYVSCSNCTKKLQRTVSAFTCLDCNNTNAVGVLKTDVCSICSHRIYFHWRLYRVEMSIADENVEGLFVCFDGVMTKLHNMRAYEACHLLVCFYSACDDDNGDDNSGAISVRVKVETGGISQVQGSSGIKKKARTAWVERIGNLKLCSIFRFQ